MMGAGQVLVLVVWSFLLATCVHSRTAEEWKSRIIYQLLTDRFSPSGAAPSQPCTDLRNYCGGTFRGVAQHLDYIQGLG
ncbi:hypothetical protein C0Q70_16251 [Pomacea canaliculata]|uniref:Uncharacterized protein n=1 Tax=Pomacea canaliculata TaxID=400727 RepID=A0A2T7NP91_POMCA|nr:hypothetical protein C0Q70_16251 [Pomacea canaliculata]